MSAAWGVSPPQDTRVELLPGVRLSSLTDSISHLMIPHLRAWGACVALGLLAVAPSASAQSELTAWRERAQRGDAEALNALGNAYALGQGVPRDDGEALRHYEAAAALNHAPACFNLGLIYELGRGVPRNEAEAVNWYRRAAAQNHPRAAYHLAVMLEDGRGVARDEAGAARHYRIAAEQGIGVAQASLGLMLAAGRGGLTTNLPEAYAWLSLAVENGGAPASRNLVQGRMSATERSAAERVLADLLTRFPTVVPDAPVAAAGTTASAGTSPALPVATVGISLGAMDTERADLRASVAQLTTENRELSAALNTTEREVRRLEQALAAPRPAVPVETALVPNEAIGRLTAEKQTVQAELEKSRAAVEENLRVIAELTDEVARLGASPPPTPDPVVLPSDASAPLREQLAAAQARVDELIATLAARTRERDDAMNAPPPVVPVSDAGSNAQWTEGLAEANRTTATYQSAVAELTGANADLSREVQDLRMQVGALSGAVQILRGDNARLAAQVGVAPATGAAPVLRLPPPQSVTITGRAVPTRPGAPVTVNFTPPQAPPTPPVRVHTVASGESLSGISLRYYGTARRWPEIFEANRDSLRAAQFIRPGQRLRIP